MEQRKRIIFTVINDMSYDQRMHKICRALADAGWDVLLTGRLLPSSKALKPEVYKQKRLRCWFNKGKLFYLEYNLRLFFFLLFSETEVIGAVDADTLVPCFVVSHMRSRKLVFDAHEYFSEVPELVHRPLSKKVWQWVERLLIPRIKNKYTVSETLAKEFERVYRSPFEVIRNLPLASSVEPTVKSEKFILYQGALNEGRALEELIKAMHKIEIRLKLVGEGDLSESLRKLVAIEGLEYKVDFLGYRMPEELEKITEKAFIGYNLLHHLGQSYYFSLSNKFFDYLQAGVPSLNPAFPEYNHVLGTYRVGITCEPKTADIAASINRLLADEGFYHNLQSECLRVRHLFTWGAEAKKLIKFYDTLR